MLKLFTFSIFFLFFVFGCKNNSDSQKLNQDISKTDFFESEDYIFETQSAGSATSFDFSSTSHAFSYPLPLLSDDEILLHNQGDALFEQNFSDELSSPQFGLGPVYNNSNCLSCHNADGRGSLPAGLNETTWIKLQNNQSLIFKISIENSLILNQKESLDNYFNAPVPVPGFSDQLFHLGVLGLRSGLTNTGTAEIWLKNVKKIFQYPDGTKISLSKPVFEIRNPYDTELNNQPSRIFESDVRFSPRIGLPMFGLGLLESIPEQDILKQAAIDRSAEGVKGVPNYVFDIVKYRQGDIYPLSLGRFGVKANTPNLDHQAMAALNHDMGVTNSLFPDENIQNTDLYQKYLNLFPQVQKIEAGDLVQKALIFYSRTLAVPPRRNVNDPFVIEGAQIFKQIRCTSCHTPQWTIGDQATHDSFKNQKIYPYTDLLLHDMGEELADNRKDFRANGRQWKTRALWGLGLTKVVNPRAGFLHDGRAQSLEEAILWHGGEGEFSRNKFIELSKVQRDKLIQFLNSL